MNRLFHAKIEWSSWALLAIVLGITLYSIWEYKNGILLCALLLFLVIIIERIIHTTYTVTADKQLVIHTGRFSKDKVIPLSHIREVRKIESIHIMGKPLRSCVIVEYREGKIISLIPSTPDDFIRYIEKRMKEDPS